MPNIFTGPPRMNEFQRQLLTAGLGAIPVAGPFLSGGYALGRGVNALAQFIGRHVGSGSNANPQGPVDPANPNNPLNDTGSSDAPYYPPTWSSNGGYTPQPINSAGSLGQRAGNQEANFIADFNQLQSKGGEGFSRPDDIRPFGHAAYNSTQANPAMLSAARRYMSAYPMGSTIPAIQNFNNSVSSGATPTWQQYLGRPAYTPPTAGRGFDFGTPPSPTGPVYGPPVPSSNPPPKMDLSGLISLWGKKG